MTDKSHDLISPTAKLTAYLRAKTDIPFSKQISQLCNCKKTVEEIFGTNNTEWKAPKIELRYKSLSKVLEMEMKTRGISQVLELAAGILPRGMILSSDPSIHYIETDLPGIMEEKKKLIVELDPDFLERENYKLLPMNAVNPEDFLKILDYLHEDKVAVINEGLLAYLSIEEKEIVAKNIHTLLKNRGGVWITPDLSNSDGMKKIISLFPEAREVNQQLAQAVQRDMKANSIGTKEEAVEFYRKIGFSITEIKDSELRVDVTTLQDIADVNLRTSLEEALGDSSVWVLEAR